MQKVQYARRPVREGNLCQKASTRRLVPEGQMCQKASKRTTNPERIWDQTRSNIIPPVTRMTRQWKHYLPLRSVISILHKYTYQKREKREKRANMIYPKPVLKYNSDELYKQFSAISYSILIILQYGTMNYLHWSDGVCLPYGLLLKSCRSISCNKDNTWLAN